VRGRPHEIAFGLAVHLALDQLVDERRDVGVPAAACSARNSSRSAAVVRAGLLLQRWSSRRASRAGPAPAAARFLHQSRDGEARHLHFGRASRLRRPRIARLHRGARGDECRQPGRPGIASASSPAAATCRSGPRAARRRRRRASHAPARAAAGAGRRDLGRQAERTPDEPHQQVAADESGDHQQDQQIERDLDAIGGATNSA